LGFDLPAPIIRHPRDPAARYWSATRARPATGVVVPLTIASAP
jgi:hypothetical protein